jgi:hypothetical protein
MYFKAKILEVLDENNLSDFIFSLDQNTGKEIIIFMNHAYEIERNNEGNINEVSYYNQCINTFDIEEKFIQLLLKMLNDNQSVSMIDFNGREENLTKEDLEEII